MSLQHIQKNSPRLLPKPAKFEKNPPNGYRVIRKTKCGAGGAGSSPIHKQASLAGRLNIYNLYHTLYCKDKPSKAVTGRLVFVLLSSPDIQMLSLKLQFLHILLYSLFLFSLKKVKGNIYFLRKLPTEKNVLSNCCRPYLSFK